MLFHNRYDRASAGRPWSQTSSVLILSLEDGVCTTKLIVSEAQMKHLKGGKATTMVRTSRGKPGKQRTVGKRRRIDKQKKNMGARPTPRSKDGGQGAFANEDATRIWKTGNLRRADNPKRCAQNQPSDASAAL